MLSDQINKSDYYSSVEVIASSSPVRGYSDSKPEYETYEVQEDTNDISVTLTESLIREEEEEIDKKKRKNDLTDDFFSLSQPLRKKKKKKHRLKREKAIRRKTKDLHVSSDLLEVSPDFLKGADKGGEQLYSSEFVHSSSNLNDSHTSSSGDEGIEPIPAFDRKSFIEKTRKQRMVKRKCDEEALISDTSDDEDLEFLRLVPVTRSLTSDKSHENQSLYRFTDSNELNRKYVVRVTSKLVDGSDMKTDFLTYGTKKFSRILRTILAHFQTAYKSNADIQKRYEADKVSLIWIDGKMEIKQFFKPSTLRIFPKADDALLEKSPTVINCLLIPKENSLNFVSIYPEFKTKVSDSLISEISGSSTFLETGELSSEENEASNENESNIIVIDETDADSYFTIGLKGADNKRIEVQVSPSTRIRNLLHFYLKQKNIDSSIVRPETARLIFDDEELNLEARVGETELEEDFEVQVFL